MHWLHLSRQQRVHSTAWRYHTGRFMCKNSIPKVTPGNWGKYSLLRYSPLDQVHHIGWTGLKTSMYQLLARVFIYNSNRSKKSFTLNHTLAILHCSRSKNLFRVTLSPFSEQVESLFLFSGVSWVCLCLGATTPSKLWEIFSQILNLKFHLEHV